MHASAAETANSPQQQSASGRKTRSAWSRWHQQYVWPKIFAPIEP